MIAVGTASEPQHSGQCELRMTTRYRRKKAMRMGHPRKHAISLVFRAGLK